jgi:uncharacterized protein with beta-barrel porin domain
MNWTNGPRRRELAAAVCVSLSLAGCGGGGGSHPSQGAPVVVTPTPPSTPSQPTSPGDSPPADIQLTATGADVAHAAHQTGSGVTIGIVDSGVTAANPALTGRVTTKLNYVDSRSNNLNVDDVVGHGTAVAEIAAGRPVGQFAGGIAPDATIVSARIVSDTTPKDDGSGRGNRVTSADPLGAVNEAVFQSGARISNNSWGGLYWDATDTATTASFADAYKHASLSSQGTLYVFAAGNDGAANPSDIAALPLRVNNLAGWITVVALDSKNPSQIASYSNRCGDAKAFCLAAPGSVVTLSATSTAAKPVYEVWTGTSLAAPQVSGAAAVLVGAFPHFDNEALRTLILGTADDLGDPGVDAVYGNGRLNLGRAILGPARIDYGDFRADIGSSNVTFSNDISGDGIRVSGSGKLTITGKNSFGSMYVGDTATVEVMNDMPVADLTVATSGAKIIVHGDLGSGPMNGYRAYANVNGTIEFTEHPTHINADFSLYGLSRMSVLLGAPVTVSGFAQLNGDLYIAGATQGYVVTNHQSILTANSVTGTFKATTLAQGVFLSAQVQYAPKEVWVDTTALKITAVAGSSATMSRSAAAMNSATRLDSAFGQIQGAVSMTAPTGALPSTTTLLAAGQIQQASNETIAKDSLESLSGQLYAAGTAVTLAGIDAGNSALMAHLDQQGTGAWTQSLNDQGAMNRGGFGRVGFNLNGGLIGNDIRLGLNGFAGIALAQMSTSGQLNGSFDRQRSRSTAGMFYAGTRGTNWYGVGQFGVGSFSGDMRRVLQFGEQAAFAGSDQDGSYNSAYGEVGYRSYAGAFTLTPFASVSYASIHRNGFSENGGDGFGLTADGHSTSRWQGGVGLRAGSSWLTAYGKLRLDTTLGWQNAFATRGEVFAARYTGFAQWAPVDGIGLSRRAGTLGLALGWDSGEHTHVGFNVDQRVADRDHSHSANLNFRMDW